MITAADIPQMSKGEKIAIMELLWADLTSAKDEPASPAWHEEALRQTAARVASGAEVAMDWTTAKEMLRRERSCK